MSAGAEITGLRQVVLTVGDVAKSVAFYRDQLGLKFLFSAGPNLAFFDLGGVRLMLAAPEREFKPGTSSVLYLKVADIIAAHRELGARGVSFTREPHFLTSMSDHDLWLCELRDPDGNPLALMCERPKS